MTGFGIFLFPKPPINRWTVGWLTGRDNDLICVKPNIEDYQEAEIALSPVCTNVFFAILGFLFKRILIKIDRNCML